MRVVVAVLGLALVLASVASCGGGGGNGGAPRPGTLFFSQDLNPNGLFVLDVRTGAATHVAAGTTKVSSGSDGRTVGLTESPVDGVLWGTTHGDVVLIAADGSGANVLDGTASAEGLAYHEPSGVYYGTEDGAFFTIQPTTGLVLAPLAPPGEDLEGLASDAATNRIYAIGDTTLLYAYSVGSNTWSVVGDTGINWDSGGLAFDPDARVLYAVGEGGGDNLYRIDPVTAVPTLVGPTGISPTQGGLGFVPAR